MWRDLEPAGRGEVRGPGRSDLTSTKRRMVAAGREAEGTHAKDRVQALRGWRRRRLRERQVLLHELVTRLDLALAQRLLQHPALQTEHRLAVADGRRRRAHHRGGVLLARIEDDIAEVLHAGVEGEDEQDVGDRLAIKNGIAQRFDTEADGNEFLNQTSEAKLARAIDIGEEDDDDDDDERADKRRRNDDDDDDDDDE